MFSRRMSFFQGTGENGNDDDGPNMRELVASGQALGPARPTSTPTPEPPAETSAWVEQPQANPFMPSAPLPVGPQPTSHPYSPPEREMGPPSNPEYNPLAGLADPYVPPYARPGAQPTPGPGSPEHLAQYATPGNYGDPGVMGPPPRPPDVDRGPQSEQPGRGIFAGPSVLSSEQQEIVAMQQRYQDTMVAPPDIQEAQDIAADREAPTSSGSVLDFSGGSLGGPNPWDRTTPSPEPEPEEEDGGGSWWDWAPGDFNLDAIPQRALNVISGTGNVDETIQNAVDPRVAPVPESEELDYAGGLEAETREWAQEQVDTARYIASDPIGAGKYLGNPTNWGHIVGEAVQNYQDNPEDAFFDFGFGTVTSAATGAATAGAGGLIYRGLNRIGVPDVPASAAGTASSVVRGASGVPDVNAPSPAAAPSPGVARLITADAADVPSPAAAAAPDVLGPQYQLPDVAPAVARTAGPPELSGPQYQLPDAPAVSRAAGPPDASGPQYQLPAAPAAVARTVDAPDLSGPHYELPDAPAVVRAAGPPTSGRSVAEMAAAARAAAPDVEDVVDAAPGSYLNRLDTRWNAGIERRQQRRSARQPTNIARRIVGRDQVFKPYTLGQRTSTRIGDWVGGGPGAEGSPNLLRQYVRSRMNRTDTMPEFPEGTNRALTAYENATWRNRQLMRNPNRVRHAANAVGNVVETAQDVNRFLNPEQTEPVRPFSSMYGEEEAISTMPRAWRRPNPRFAAQATPASQAYGQKAYTAGRGYGSGT